VQPKIKGFENPDKNHTNPLQNKKIPTQNQGAQSKSEQKNEKIGGFSGEWVSGFVGNQWGKMGDLGGRRWFWVVENGRRWCLGGGEGGCQRWVWVVLDFWEERTRDGFRGLYGGWEKMGGKGEKM
jgi:hypothetical protein